MSAKGSDDDEHDSDSDEEEAVPMLLGVTRVWAPDAVIALLTGPFTEIGRAHV